MKRIREVPVVQVRLTARVLLALVALVLSLLWHGQRGQPLVIERGGKQPGHPARSR